ncbi:MAG: hypothetical protein AABW86_01590 [Candidatus Micrarchaeota archaeon]
MTYNAVLFVLGVGAIILSAVIAVYGEMIFGVYEMMIDAEGAPCEKLPSISDAEKIIEEHNETFKKIESLSQNVEIRTERCEGKAVIFINYGAKAERDSIKNMMGDTFFGIPYTMHNV